MASQLQTILAASRCSSVPAPAILSKAGTLRKTAGTCRLTMSDLIFTNTGAMELCLGEIRQDKSIVSPLAMLRSAAARNTRAQQLHATRRQHARHYHSLVWNKRVREAQ
jgi:hypothetical protein